MAYRISELGALVGLSRSTLLYYEKLGLITGKRRTNGYRVYGDKELQRLRLLQQLKSGGLTLSECKACLGSKADPRLLEQRLQILDEEISRKQQARELLAALLGKGSLRRWHETTDRMAPEAHLDWLKQQGFDEKEALHLKWLSKDMNEHEHYMADFMAVFQPLDRWGPGTEADSLRALALLSDTPARILDIGCGKGLSATLLAQHTHASVTAVDNEPSALAQFESKIVELGLQDRISTRCVSMTELPFDLESFDLIWAEGSAYIMGFENALHQWRPLLRKNGSLVLSELVWLSNNPSANAAEFWQHEYPDMQNIATRVEQIKNAGYELIGHFTLSHQAWLNYYLPLEARIAQLRDTLPNSRALEELSREVELYEQYLGEFGYEMFVLGLQQ